LIKRAGSGNLIALCIEGYKLHHKPGYDMNLVKYQREHVNDAKKEFESIFKRYGVDKEGTIRQIEEKYKEVLRL
jgi:hypothetical protein